MQENVGNCLTDEQKYKERVEIKDKEKQITRDFVNNFPTNLLKSITFLHPMGVCGQTFHHTEELSAFY